MTTQTKELDKVTLSFGASAAIAIVFSSVLTIVKEMYPPLLAYMKTISIMGVKHHWLVHGLLVVALFYVLGWIFSKNEDIVMDDGVVTNAVIWSTILGSLAILGFFLIELFH